MNDTLDDLLCTYQNAKVLEYSDSELVKIADAIVAALRGVER